MRDPGGTLLSTGFGGPPPGCGRSTPSGSPLCLVQIRGRYGGSRGHEVAAPAEVLGWGPLTGNCGDQPRPLLEIHPRLSLGFSTVNAGFTHDKGWGQIWRAAPSLHGEVLRGSSSPAEFRVSSPAGPSPWRPRLDVAGRPCGHRSPIPSMRHGRSVLGTARRPGGGTQSSGLCSVP